jgi:hypothetical protein
MKRLPLAVVLLLAVIAINALPEQQIRAVTVHQASQFEVASVKPTKQQMGGVRQGCHAIDSKIGPNDARALIPLGRCVVTAGRLSHMIGMAYGISMDMLSGGPDWVATGNDRGTTHCHVPESACRTIPAEAAP